MSHSTRTILAIALLFGGALPATLADQPAAAEKEAKKPVGTWKRVEGEGTTVITITADTIKLSVESPKLKIQYEADCAITKDNKAVFGRIRTVSKDDDKRIVGDVVGFACEVQGDLLVVSDFRGSGVVGLGALFMNGNYRKEAPKKD